eukprot:6490883-Amphidinium_carterae.2
MQCVGNTATGACTDRVAHDMGGLESEFLLHDWMMANTGANIWNGQPWRFGGQTTGGDTTALPPLLIQPFMHDGGTDGPGKETGEPLQRRKARNQTTRMKSQTILRMVTINTRSLLCDKNPGLAETARSHIFRQEMLKIGATIVCVQETKLDKIYVKDCMDYEAVAVSPEGRVGGLQILVAKNKGFAIKWSRTFSHRVLAVGIVCEGEAWCIINAYAPTSLATELEFRLFWHDVKMAIEHARKNGLPIMIGADLNTRLGGARDDIHIGPAVTGQASADQKYREEDIASALEKYQLAAWSTMSGDPHTTWTSPHETDSQIDYLIGDYTKLDRLVSVQVFELECFASDHKIVTCDFYARAQKQEKRHKVRPMAAKIRGPDHSLAVKLALLNEDHSSWMEEEDPLRAIAAFVKQVKQVVKRAPGSMATVKKEWIGGTTWQQIRRGAEIRRLMNKRWKQTQRAKLKYAFEMFRSHRRADAQLTQTQGMNYPVLVQEGIGREGNGHVEQPVAIYTLRQIYRVKGLAWALARIASRRQSKCVQRMVKQDKDVWLQEKTDELAQQCIDGDVSAAHKQVKRCLIKLRPNPAATQRAPLVDPDGKIHTTQDEKEILWQTHWTRLYGAHVKNTVEDFKSCSMENDVERNRPEVAEADWFTYDEVRAAIRHQMNGKASIDGIPSRELVVLLDRMTPVWQRAFNHFLVEGAIPRQYRGTLLFMVPKKTATATTGDFRGLQLMVWSAKIFTRGVHFL